MNSQTTRRPDPVQAGTPAPTLLVVDDDRLVLATLGQGLREAGFHVIEAESGEAALGLCQQHSPDLALVDQRMPGLSGLELARRLTEEGVPFLFLTACADPQVVQSAMKDGALAYLVKPLDLTQVIPTVHTALRRAAEIEILRSQTVQLSAALRQGRDISTAVGLVMARLSLTQEEALERLRQHARSGRVRLEEVARALIAGEEEGARLYRQLPATKKTPGGE